MRVTAGESVRATIGLRCSWASSELFVYTREVRRSVVELGGIVASWDVTSSVGIVRVVISNDVVDSQFLGDDVSLVLGLQFAPGLSNLGRVVQLRAWQGD